MVYHHENDRVVVVEHHGSGHVVVVLQDHGHDMVGHCGNDHELKGEVEGDWVDLNEKGEGL